MQRALATLVLGIYAVLAVGFHLHVHYCCGKIADVTINQVTDACVGSCSKHVPAQQHNQPVRSCCNKQTPVEEAATGCSVDRHCCSSDDFYIIIDDEHQKTSVEFEMFVRFALEPAPKTIECPNLAAPKSVDVATRAGPPLWLLYGSRKICEGDASGLLA
jgi:hypothetical protein